MRISDWSSDVCSSDLAPARIAPAMALPVRFANGFLIDQNTKARAFGDSQEASFRCQHFGIGDEAQQIVAHIIMDANRHLLNCDVGRSEERRVGKECDSTCRFRWSPYD